MLFCTGYGLKVDEKNHLDQDCGSWSRELGVGVKSALETWSQQGLLVDRVGAVGERKREQCHGILV